MMTATAGVNFMQASAQAQRLQQEAIRAQQTAARGDQAPVWSPVAVEAYRGPMIEGTARRV